MSYSNIALLHKATIYSEQIYWNMFVQDIEYFLEAQKNLNNSDSIIFIQREKPSDYSIVFICRSEHFI